MFRFLSISLVLLLTSITAFTQEKQSKCSELTVTGPAAVVLPGAASYFEAVLTPPMDLSKFTIMWTVENGKIISGQGTLRLEVSYADAGEVTTATAVVTGLGRCNRSESDTGVICECAEPVLIDEFGALPDDELQLRIENVLEKLGSDPTAKGYIVTYGKFDDITGFQVKVRELLPLRIDVSKIILVNGGDNDGKELKLRTRIWIVPAGADTEVVN